MSWKSIVCTGLFIALASPVLAQPTLGVANANLDANGNWLWHVTINPGATNTPIGGELGFRETVTGSQLVSAARIDTATNFDTENPGTQIFTWETLTDVDPAAGVTNMKPVGLQVNTTNDEVFSALGSVNFATTGAKAYADIATQGPIDTRLTSVIQVLGKYATASPHAGANGRIAQFSGASSVNYSNFSGTATRTVVLGDVNMSGGAQPVTGADLGILSGNLGKPFGTTGLVSWSGGDLNGDGTGVAQVTGADLGLLARCLGKTTAGGACTNVTTVNNAISILGVVDTPPGAGGGSGVPEPASVALAALAVLGAAGLTRRRK